VLAAVRRRLLLRLTPALAAVALAAPAAAQPIARPKFEVAIGMGTSFDGNAPNRPDNPITSFFFTAGLGDGLFGLDLRSFANGASNVQVTRISVEIAGLVRPFALLESVPGYGGRVLRALAIHAGPAYERVSLGMAAEPRFGAAVGADVDLPLGEAGLYKGVHVRIGVRRMLGEVVKLDDLAVHDSSAEVYGQLAFVF
jgi:hypothetical protein